LENLTLLEQNFGEGKLQVRFKHWNGRVRVMVSLSFSILSPPFLLLVFFLGGLVGVVAPDYEASNCHNKYSVFRAKDFISISQTSILHLFHLNINYSIKLIKAFCQRSDTACINRACYWINFLSQKNQSFCWRKKKQWREVVGFYVPNALVHQDPIT
jgi:hypothetical protein